MTASKDILVARGLDFSYRPGRPVLHAVDLTAAPGKLLCVLGPNGSGKTSLLRCLLGRLKPSAGTIRLAERELGAYKPRALARKLAYVPQFATSAFAFTVQELVMMGRFAHAGVLGLAGKSDLAVAHEAMRMTETLAFASRSLEELSGGESQCVMIARALAQQPSVMLLDEPTSHLDIRNQLKIYRMMQRLAHEWRMAVVCVSHDVNLAGRFADELALMREGRLVAAGPPKQIMCEEVLRKAYDVEIDLIDIEGRDVPIVWAR